MKFQKHRQYELVEWRNGEVKTWEAKIYIAGEIDVAKKYLREECFRKGLCVTISETEYIYTGGSEKGFVVGMIQYPPFPEKEKDLENRAIKIGKDLSCILCQWSFSIVTNKKTFYFSRRERKI